MYDFKRWMVALDFSEMDEILIKYISFMADMLKPEHISFIHVQKEHDLPAELAEGMEDAAPEKLKNRMQKEVLTHFNAPSRYQMSYDVEIGDPLSELLKWTHAQKIDLVIAGRKQDLKGSGLVVQLLARKISCSLLLLPQSAKHSLDRIMVPADFSEHSKMACEAMDVIGRKAGTNHHYVQNVYSLPSGYYTTGKTESEFAEIMEGHAKRRCNEFAAKMVMPKGTEYIFSFDNDDEPSDQIINAARAVAANLIIIGARGRTDATSFLLGSVTEKLISRDYDIPLLIIKSKDRSFNFFELLKTI